MSAREVELEVGNSHGASRAKRLRSRRGDARHLRVQSRQFLPKLVEKRYANVKMKCWPTPREDLRGSGLRNRHQAVPNGSAAATFALSTAGVCVATCADVRACPGT